MYALDMNSQMNSWERFSSFCMYLYFSVQKHFTFMRPDFLNCWPYFLSNQSCILKSLPCVYAFKWFLCIFFHQFQSFTAYIKLFDPFGVDFSDRQEIEFKSALGIFVIPRTIHWRVSLSSHGYFLWHLCQKSGVCICAGS